MTLAEHALLSQRFRGRKTPLPFGVCARKAAILHGKIWSAHESDVVGVKTQAIDIFKVIL